MMPPEFSAGSGLIVLREAENTSTFCRISWAKTEFPAGYNVPDMRNDIFSFFQTGGTNSDRRSIRETAGPTDPPE
jgi:hypothetical protein